MEKLAIVTDNSRLNKLVTTAIASGIKYRALLHHAACSAVHHAAATGQISPMDRLFKSLTANDQFAFKIWLGNYHVLIGLGVDKLPDNKLTSDERNAALEAGRVFTHTEANGWKIGTVKVDANMPAKRSAMERHMVAALEHAPFFAVDNVKSIREVSDASILAALKQLVAKATAKSDENTIVKVDQRVAKRVKDFVDTFEVFVGNLAVEKDNGLKHNSEAAKLANRPRKDATKAKDKAAKAKLVEIAAKATEAPVTGVSD